MTPVTAMLLNTRALIPPANDPLAATKAEFGRLMHAAIISPRFRQHLLTNPEKAIENGYMGESFHFTPEIKSQLAGLQAGTLEEFASQVLEIVETPSHAEMVVLHSR
ncbi:hypothetical protein [Leptolinea tardivitalis]|uniref:Uncharacterized protein n=1 Tax=Leptolinea tardivitalis TaxID=229920 RepID=A0A0P6WKV9_9CHLR|nr:hypothetical protein [Leptolinea tardivitalis]KPL70427.1 hypothetical protein ADM99_14865 [Leptolinea tardivitalis]GAP22003.1 hypothetical protein LTAR_02221 [Leptolinea tardivitalis]